MFYYILALNVIFYKINKKIPNLIYIIKIYKINVIYFYYLKFSKNSNFYI